MKIITTTILATLILTGASAFAQLNWDGPQDLDVLYKNVSGEELRIDVYLPKDAVSATPVVVYTHGGGWAAGSKEDLSNGSQSQVALGLLESGVAVVSVDYRLTRVTDTDEVIMQDCIIDAKDACRFLVREQARFNINTQIMALFGDSAGGHIAMMNALTSPFMAEFRGANNLDEFQGYLVRGCVSYYAPSSFRSANEIFWTRGGRVLANFNERIFGTETDPAQQENLRELVSPFVYLNASSPPLLVFHGDLDTTIPVYHTFGFRSLANADPNIAFEYVVVRNSEHNFRNANANDISPSGFVIEQTTIDYFLDILF